MKLAIGAGRGGGISGFTACRSATTVALRRIGLGETGARAAARIGGFTGRSVDAARFAAARFAVGRFSSALGPRRFLTDLAPVFRPAFRNGRAFAIERPTLLATPGAVNSVARRHPLTPARSKHSPRLEFPTIRPYLFARPESMLELAFANGDPLEQVVDLLVIGCTEGQVEGDGLVRSRRRAARRSCASRGDRGALSSEAGAIAAWYTPTARCLLAASRSWAWERPRQTAGRALRIAAGSAVRLAGCDPRRADLGGRRGSGEPGGRRRRCVARRVPLRQIPHRRS